ASDRGIAIALGVLRQGLMRDDRSVGPAGDHVGERAAAVDSELPAVQARHVRICDTARIVRPMRIGSRGMACEESLAITSWFLRSTNKFWPWMPSPKTSGVSPSRMYHLLR